MRSNLLGTSGPACSKALAGRELLKCRGEDPAEAGREGPSLPGLGHRENGVVQPPTRSRHAWAAAIPPARLWGDTSVYMMYRWDPIFLQSSPNPIHVHAGLCAGHRRRRQCAARQPTQPCPSSSPVAWGGPCCAAHPAHLTGTLLQVLEVFIRQDPA